MMMLDKPRSESRSVSLASPRGSSFERHPADTANRSVCSYSFGSDDAGGSGRSLQENDRMTEWGTSFMAQFFDSIDIEDAPADPRHGGNSSSDREKGKRGSEREPVANSTSSAMSNDRNDKIEKVPDTQDMHKKVKPLPLEKKSYRDYLARPRDAKVTHSQPPGFPVPLGVSPWGFPGGMNMLQQTYPSPQPPVALPPVRPLPRPQNRQWSQQADVAHFAPQPGSGPFPPTSPWHSTELPPVRMPAHLNTVPMGMYQYNRTHMMAPQEQQLMMQKQQHYVPAASVYPQPPPETQRRSVNIAKVRRQALSARQSSRQGMRRQPQK
ncbi:hypothetical protein DQ04_05541030 [Trypanosoma grayi]|uniref:hypothetical protein n=1 Tax=Trypanosoma grayi TaxID=71804 RepID=UPI0004F47A66|nr:hypothetical protein DQ04_05541030 [Trypanosoma grayi]KEG09248.1 hypothetical protein DQ04_05541030 [Trypanosoma grayi]